MVRYLLSGRYADDLALLEIGAVLSRFSTQSSLVRIAHALFRVESGDEKVFAALEQTGSLVKMLTPVHQWESAPDVEELASKIQLDNPSEKLTFGFTDHRAHDDQLTPKEFKKGLQNRGVKSRFVDTEREGLPWIVMHREQGLDVHVFLDNNATILAQASWVQPVEEWVERDMQKPYRDMVVGMLPPKLARTMVQLGIGNKQPNDCKILDPFCGSGTILLEGSLMGVFMLGSDSSKTAVQGTIKNLQWMSDLKQLTLQYSILCGDATHLSEFLDLKQIDAVVTEPFMGTTTWRLQELPNIMKGLEKLYLGFFRELRKHLRPDARIVIVLPAFHTPQGELQLPGFVDRLAELGYTRENEPIRYPKPGGRVTRQLYIFTLQK